MAEDVLQEKRKEIEEKIKYQRAIYRYYECDDPALKEHFLAIIKAYEHVHKQRKEDPRQMLLPLAFGRAR